MKVLIIKGSPRKNGVTSQLADSFRLGAVDSKNDVEEIYLINQKINDCLGCSKCQMTKKCIQNDDMLKIYDKIIQSDVIVLASPVYFYSWTSIMKRFLDRTYALISELKDKDFYLLSAGAAPDISYMDTMVNSFKEYVSVFDNCRVKDFFFAFDADNFNKKKSVMLENVYNMGLKIR